MTQPRTLFEKIWENHVVQQDPGSPAVLYIDLQLVHEVTSPQAFSGLRERSLKVRRPERTMATIDHSVPTLGGSAENRLTHADEAGLKQIRQLEDNCREFGIRLYGLDSDRQGVVHVTGPELGLTQPGMTIVCGDSHTATHGAFGALAFGIGTSEVQHVLATQCLLQNKPKNFEVKLEGCLQYGVTAKDVILAVINRLGVNGGTGYVFEYTGSTARALSMEERMTLCNMTIEAGARAGMVAPDETTYEYLAGRPFIPTGKAWEASLDAWKKLPSDEGAVYDDHVSIDVTNLEPMITFGTNPGMSVAVTACVPSPQEEHDLSRRTALEKALAYMALRPGMPMRDQPIDVVFLGSCTNGRLSDLRQAAAILKNRKIYDGVRMLVVPGSQQVRLQAEAEGLHEVFMRAGAEWRDPGCSMCIAMNGDQAEPGQYVVSTSNRNFEGRQGKGARTFLASPATAAAAAVTGHIADPRRLM